MFTATGRDPRRTAAALAWWAVVVTTVATVAVVAVPFLRFAYRAPAFHIVLETANAVIALVVAYLVYGRFRERRGAQDLFLVMALCSVAVANLVLTALPSAVALGGDEEVSRWAALAIRFLGTLLLVAAAVTPAGRRLQGPQLIGAVLVITGLVVALGILGTAYSGLLPATVDPTLPLDDARRPVLAAHSAVLGVQGIGAVLYAIAAVAFTRQAVRTGDELVRWVGAGCVLAAGARVHYLLYPSLYSGLRLHGDLLRLGFYLFLLTGAAREIRSYWEVRARAAVLEDRRRMARDLHDGLAQELAYIAAQSQRRTAEPDAATTLGRISAAATRATDEARRAISALARPVDEPFPLALRRVVDELAHRLDVKIVTVADDAVEVGEEQEEALLRIVAEAVRNAERHGAAARIEVRLTAAPLRLSVTDDGRGFDVAARSTAGFGITSMYERAAGAGAVLALRSVPGEGTTVEVTWP